MTVREYGCNTCRITFRKPDADNPEDKDKAKCPRCGSSNIEKFDSPADKLRFFGSFAFSGG